MDDGHLSQIVFSKIDFSTKNSRTGAGVWECDTTKSREGGGPARNDKFGEATGAVERSCASDDARAVLRRRGRVLSGENGKRGNKQNINVVVGWRVRTNEWTNP